MNNALSRIKEKATQTANSAPKTPSAPTTTGGSIRQLVSNARSTYSEGGAQALREVKTRGPRNTQTAARTTGGTRLQRIKTSDSIGGYTENSFQSTPFDPAHPTLRSTLGAMQDAFGSNPKEWQKYFGIFQQETQNSSSPIYSPYLFNKPATNPKYAAQNEAATQKFEAQWADAKAKAAYWAGRTDLNLSDDDIIARVNLDGYSEIKALNKDIAQGKTGYYTRSLGYSPEVLYGVIWAARNGGSTGNDLADLTQYARGVGNGYERNDDIQARLDPVSERYNPYSVGSTADDLTSYFGVAQFDTDWLQKNRYLLNGDDNDVKRYQQVYAAEQTTLQAEAEYAELQNRLQSWFKTDVDDPDAIMEQLFKADDILGTKALDTLGKMDESLRSGKIMTMTRPVEYSYREIEAQVRQHCEEVKAQKQTAELANEISEATGAGNTDIDANTNINLSRSRNVQNSWPTVQRYGTPGEKLAFATSAPGYEAYQQQVSDAVTTAQMSPEKTYAMLLYDANQYAAKNYLAVREEEDAYREALARYDEEIADLRAQGVTEEELARWYPKPERKEAQISDIVQSYETAAKLNGVNGADTSLLKVMDYLYDNGKDYVPTQWSATTAFQMLLDSGEYSYEQVAQGARETIEQKQAKIEEINGVLKKAEEAGVAGADKYVRNLRRQVEACQQDIDDAKYFLIPEEKDFKEVVSAYREKAKEAWSGFDLFAGFKTQKDGVPQFDYQLATIVNEKTGRRGIHDNQSDRYINFLTDNEIDTYLYISATQGYDKAQEYYNHLKEEALPVRASNAVAENTADIASSGALGAAAATALSVLASPAQAVGTVYSAIAAIRGDEINPYHGSFAANMFITSARGTVKSEINDALGEDTGWAKFANMAYDALTSSGDSLLSGAIGSGIAGSIGGIASKIPGGGKVAAYMADKGASVSSVLFMGQEAASGAVMDAKLRGATDTQALLMGGITWAAESGTEFLPMEKILDAFKGSSTEAARGLVARVVRSVFVEAPGEMVNELLEGIADDQIMGAMSERDMAVREYMANGMSEEEAERQATKDFVSDILYAGATGAMSGAMSTSTAWLGGKLHRQGTGTEAQTGTDTGVDTTQEAAANTVNAQGTAQQQGAPLTEAQAQRANEILQEKMAKNAQNNETGRLLNLTESNAADAAESRKMQAFEAFYPQLTALSKARLTQNKAGVSSVISGVMQALGLDAETARAAGQTLVERIGGDRAVSAMQRILYSSVEQGIDTGEAAKAIAYNALAETESGANTVYELSFGSIGSIPAETLNSFIAESLTNANAEGSMQQMQKRVTDNAIANMMREVVADGGLDGVRTYEVALRQAEENVRTARENLERVQAERDAAAQNLQDIQAKFAQTPADPQIAGAMQQATRDMEGKAKVVAEYLQSMRKFQTQQQVAETTLSNAQESAMTKVRQEAVQRVMEQRAALEAEARAADEAARQMLAQAQENVAAENSAQSEELFDVGSAAQNAVSVNPGVSNSTLEYSYEGQEGTQRTQAEANTPVISPIETARQLAGELGIGATLGTRKMDVSKRGQVPKEVLGYYERRAKYMAVREGEASNFGVTMHEAGHAIADKTGLTGTQEMIDHLAPEFAKNYSADKLGREAFAEFTRLYMQDSTQAEAFAGREFMQQFETALRNAGIDKAVHTARDRIQSYEAATTLERVRASWIDQADTVRKGSLAEREAAFVTEVFDWTRPMEDVDKAVYKQTGEYGNLRTTAKRRNFTDRVVSNLFTNALTDADGKVIGEAFSKAFEGIDAKNADDFISYALMKHALDRDAQGKQVLANDITTQQMQRQIVQMEEASPEYAEALDKFENSWNKFMQAWMVDTGMLSQADFDAMRAMYPHYLPTQRYLGNEAGYRGGRGTFTLRSAKGSDLQVINPLDSIANYVQRIVDTVYKNNAALEWHNAFQTTEGLGQYAREITSDMARESVNTEDVQAQVRRILEDAKTDGDVLADVLNAIGPEAVAWRDTGTSKEGNVLAVQLPDGTKVYYQFTQEGKLLYNALTGNGKATSAQVTAALRPLARLTGFMSKMATTYAPTFAASNPIKDIQSSINYGSWATTYGDGMVKWARAFYEVWKEKGEYRNYLAMGGGGWNAVQTGTRAAADKYRAKLFKDYWKRDAKSRIGHVGEKVMDVITLDRLNEIIENTSRYAEYRFGKHDKSTAEGNMKAFQAAQEVTTDFASGGAGKAVVAARSIIPFLNPNLQGVYRAVRELTGRERGREGARMAKRIFNMAMVSAIAAVLRNAQGDEDDKKRYAMISDEIKTGHIIVPNWFNKNSDRRFVRIPISQDPFDQAIHSIVTSAIEQYDGTDDFITELLAGASAIVSNVTLGVSELLEDGDVEARLNGIMSGTVFGPIWGLATNQNYYGGQIISDRLGGLSNPLQYDDTTPEAFKWLGRVTGASPKALEYLFNQYGGYGGQLLVNTTSNVMTGDFKSLDVVKSLLTSFHKRFTIDSAYTNDISSAYSANRAFLTELKNDVQKTGTDGGLLRGGLTEDERKRAYEEAVQMTSEGGLIYETNGEISELWKQVTAAKNDPDMTDAERNQKILECRDAIADKQMAVNDVMTDYYNKYVNSPNLFERMIGGIQDVTPYTAFEKLSSTFADDYDKGSDYMMKSHAVWEATGKDSAIPHPKESFSRGGVEYTISEADWPAWEASYRDAYQAYVDANAAKWNQLTEEQKLKVLTNAHKEGNDAAKAWYVKEHEAEMRQSGK